MAKYLYKLGKWAANNSKKVIGGTLALLVVIAIFAINLGPNFSEEMSIPGTESEKALQLVKKEFPTNTGGQVQLVLKARENKTLDSNEVNKVITDTLSEIKEKDGHVVSVASPVELGNLSEDKKIGYAVVTYNVVADKVSEKSKENIIQNIENTCDAGIQTELAGDVVFSEMEIGGITEVIGIVVAYVILAITFISFLVAGMPIITAVIGLAIGLLLIVIGTNYLDITSVSITLAAMLGLAVGIDYALFIMTRFRQQRKEGYSVQESVAIATGTAGSAVVFAGITVIIALLGLSVVKIPFLTMMGLSAALCVLLAIFIAIIVVPAFLGMMGHKVGPERKNTFLSKIIKSNKKQTTSDRWGDFVAKRPWRVAIIGVVLLSIIAIPISHMELGLPDNGSKNEETTERKAYDLLTEAYGPGNQATLLVVAKTSSEITDLQLALNDTVEELSGLSNVKNVSPAIPGPSGELYLISITPETGPNDSETKDLVNNIREKSETLEKSDHIKLMVTGTTAVNIDISQKLSDALPIFAILIIGFSFILLILVFRSILVPLKAVLGFVLSLGATLGFTVFVVQDGNLINLFGFPIANPVLSFLPVIVIGILFGLAMDYEVFLVSRMREVYTHTGDARKAVLVGMRDSGGVVTAAGLIMISVFTGFMLAPDPMIKSIGLALTFGVLFDAFVVRMAIVPAVMIIMGKSAWYLPKWLDKILPDLDIEGESFMKEIERNKE
ncbi:MMPL family transporter [Bacillus sp. FSL K6-3431]|uniref:MMPL family transporter n=1 Tax=Bacillus sp. FSL K6-3431 TaxID=2921500 RepID=UPI0030F4D161